MQVDAIVLDGGFGEVVQILQEPLQSVGNKIQLQSQVVQEVQVAMVVVVVDLIINQELYQVAQD